MALPPKSAPVWQKLASGGMKKLRTSNLGAQMLSQRLELSKLPITQKADEVYDFFVKWERGLTNEIAQLGSL
ncbi:hypothetical protein EOE18_13515 [Novosphingobium umbonatum]|uniref:Uncharacterized protein n=1 Tax=Novosphingobium umbonatum TaxID=1908524 RepID=A0A437N1R9_9SPHN|nr:hypothetical protein [Novosphingobium umbonatum]RVU03876.1 hypothetical protein EOE18_13515 [Novosphingobium umbonatum]